MSYNAYEDLRPESTFRIEKAYGGGGGSGYGHSGYGGGGYGGGSCSIGICEILAVGAALAVAVAAGAALFLVTILLIIIINITLCIIPGRHYGQEEEEEFGDGAVRPAPD